MSIILLVRTVDKTLGICRGALFECPDQLRDILLQRLGFGLRQLSALRPCKMVKSYLAGLLGMGLDVSSNADYSPPCNLHKSLRGNDRGGRGGRDGPSCGVLWLIALDTDGSPSSSHVCVRET